MDEDPKQHDFDQRHDGPFDQPRPSVTIPRTTSLAAASTTSPTTPADAYHTPTSPTSPATPSTITAPRPAPVHEDSKDSSTYLSPIAPISSARSSSLPALKKTESPPVRKSVQLPSGPERSGSHPGPRRKSTQTVRHQTSRDFDVRRDGPYGRPSLTMSRRRSSGFGVGAPADHPVPSITGEGDGNSAILDATTVEMLAHTNATAFEPEPPPLNYSLADRKWSIVLFWTLMIIDCIAMPIALYFGLWYHTDLTPNIVFSIVTAALGGISIFEYFLRLWRLWKKDSTCRVIGARRMYLDWFHWNFTLGWMVIMIELIVGTVPENPPIRLLAMPVTSMLYAFGTELLVVDFLRLLRIPAPVRISSIPKGAQLRPAIYSVIEDVVAVDGSGGTAYREALNKRYEASHVFRAMLRRLGAFWAFGAQGIAVVLTILIFTIHPEAAYVVGWAAPFVWAAVWALITYFYVKKKLREEKRAWAEEIAEKAATAA